MIYWAAERKIAMKEITKVYSHIKDVKSYAMNLYDYDEKNKEEWDFRTDKETDLEEGLKHFKLPPEMKVIVDSINNNFEYMIEEISEAVHKDMLDLWKRLDALEERIGK